MFRLLVILSWLLASQVATAQDEALIPSPTAPAEWPAGVVEQEKLPTERAIDYEFDDVDVSDITGWLGWIGVELPVEAAGQLSGWLWAQRGEGGWLAFRDYRVEGKVTSPSLQLDQWVVEDAVVRFGYADGTWYVGRLHGDIRAENSEQAIAQANVAAKIPTAPSERVVTLGSLDQVDLAELARVMELEVALTGGGGELSVAGSVPLESVNELTGWTLNASLELEEVSVEGLPTADLTAQAAVRQSDWTIRQGRLDWLPEPVFIDGGGRLVDDFPFQLSLTGEGVSLSQLLIDFGQQKLAEQLAGQVDFTTEVTGNASLGIAAVDAEVASNQVLYENQPIRDVNLGLDYDPEGVELSIHSARLADGRISGSSRWDTLEQLSRPIPTFARLELVGVRLDELSDDLLPVPLSGTASGEISLASSANGEKIQWRTGGALQVADLAAFENNFGDTLVRWSKPLGSNDLSTTLLADDRALELKLFAELEDEAESELRHTRLASYSAEGRAEDFAAQLHLDAPGVEQVPVRITGSFSVAGETDNWLQRGRAELQQVTANLAGRDLVLETAVLLVNPNEFRLQRFQIFDERGRIAGAAVIRRNDTGEHRLNLRVADIPLATYAQRFLEDPALRTLAGVADVEARLVKSAADPELLSGWQGSLSAGLEALRYRGLPLGDLALQGEIENEIVDVKANGRLLDGQATLRSQLPLAMIEDLVQTLAVDRAQPSPEEPEAEDQVLEQEPIELTLNWQSVDLKRLMLLLDGLQLDAAATEFLDELALRTVEGVADLEAQLVKMPTPAGPFGGWQGDVTGSLQAVRYRNMPVGDLTLQADLTDDVLNAHLEGELLGGPATLTTRLPVAYLEDPTEDGDELSTESQTQPDVQRDAAQADAAQVDAGQADAGRREAVMLDASWTEVDLERLMQLLADAPLGAATSQAIEEFALSTLEGTGGIRVNLEKAVTSADQTSGWQGDVSARLQQLQYRGMPAGDLVLQSTLADKLFSAEVNGQLLGGDVQLSSRGPLEVVRALIADEQPGSATPAVQSQIAESPEQDNLRFEARLLGINLHRAMAVVAGPARARPYAGTASLRAEGELTRWEDLQATASFEIPLLMQGGSSLARQLAGRMNYEAGTLRILNLGGAVAGGTLDVRGAFPVGLIQTDAVNWRALANERLLFEARQIHLGQLVAFLFPAYADEFDGVVDYRGRIRFDRQIAILGSLRARDAMAFGLPIQEGIGDLRIFFNPDGSFAELSSSNLAGTAIGGDFAGDVRVIGGTRYTLNAQARVGSGKLDQLSRALGFDHIVGTGRFNARVDLQSRNAGDLAALTGGLQLDFEGGDAQSVPLLSELGRYVPLLQLASTDITGGTLQALIGQGQLRIRDFILIGDAFWIVGEGNAGLVSGRLDIDAVLETGGVTQQLSQTAVTRLAAGVLPQAALLAQINEFLSNRSLYFHIGGTTSQPVVQARPAHTIGKAILQNVRRQLLGIPTIRVLDDD